MMPALLMRTSRRSHSAVKGFAAVLIDSKDVRSHSRNFMVVRADSGSVSLISEIVASALDLLRAVRYRAFGLCFAS